MGLSTLDLPKEGGLPKTIQPGNHTLKINSIQLDDFKFIQNAKHLILNVETEEIEGFEGFMIDRDDPEGGTYKGQIGRLKASYYAFADGTTKSGIKIKRDRSILMFLGTLCNIFEASEWFADQNDAHETIEDFVDAFNEEAPFKDTFLDFCVAGKEYESKSGYTNYDIWLPKNVQGKRNIATVDSDKLMTYNEDDHLIKLVKENVSDFGESDSGENKDDSNNKDLPKKTASDFSLD